ncbi:uncharacterized protein LOC128856552 isoform X2 [Anastrepha ludens]|uniref:uncharacterized protein LOC128856552 isoform X2 n=1 Tax=Anastrepha ludens TaxID=28586 RepID=UPI0023AEE71F|nr:uncharacterized protein LOC128856552 isoform X2 [Anastrepha ludens]
MQQINSLERAFTVLTYFLSSKEFSHIDNQKFCNELDGPLIENIDNLILLGNKHEQTLGGIADSLLQIENDLRVPEQQKPILGQPYNCSDKVSGIQFCEDNRYSKNLLLIGRGKRWHLFESVEQLRKGMVCTEDCIKYSSQFFIGLNEMEKLFSANSYGFLLVFIDEDDIEHFVYVSDANVDEKKLVATDIQSSMTNFNLPDLAKRNTLTAQRIKSWKIFLKKKY